MSSDQWWAVQRQSRWLDSVSAQWCWSLQTSSESLCLETAHHQAGWRGIPTQLLPPFIPAFLRARLLCREWAPQTSGLHRMPPAAMAREADPTSWTAFHLRSEVAEDAETSRAQLIRCRRQRCKGTHASQPGEQRLAAEGTRVKEAKRMWGAVEGAP